MDDQKHWLTNTYADDGLSDDINVSYVFYLYKLPHAA